MLAASMAKEKHSPTAVTSRVSSCLRSATQRIKRGTTHLPSNGVLLYLGDTVPVGFERFERLIELVGTDEVDRTQARQRWRHYADRGYAIQRHDVKASD